MPYKIYSTNQCNCSSSFNEKSANFLSSRPARLRPQILTGNCQKQIFCILGGKYNRDGKTQRKKNSIEENSGENLFAKFATPISIIGGLATLLARSEMRFDTIDRKLSQHDTQFALINKNFENIDKRFEGIDKRFEGIDKRFEGIDKQFKSIEGDIRANSVEIQKVRELIKDELISELRRKIR